jgi:hypothetical protein
MVWLEGLCKLKKKTHVLIGNQACDLPACSIVCLNLLRYHVPHVIVLNKFFLMVRNYLPHAQPPPSRWTYPRLLIHILAVILHNWRLSPPSITCHVVATRDPHGSSHSTHLKYWLILYRIWNKFVAGKEWRTISDNGCKQWNISLSSTINNNSLIIMYIYYTVFPELVIMCAL